ncbi:hypothetical protein NKH97_11245 [Mesorhizobium sp. M0870]
MSLDRLRVLDMFLLYPPLLYRISLPSPVKAQFRELRLEAPENVFVRLPGTASIWQDLQLYQSTALTHLGGRGILRSGEIQQRRADLNAELVPEDLWKRVQWANDQERALMIFLVEGLAPVPTSGTDNIFKRSALPARGPVL